MIVGISAIIAVLFNEDDAQVYAGAISLAILAASRPRHSSKPRLLWPAANFYVERFFTTKAPMTPMLLMSSHAAAGNGTGEKVSLVAAM